jgi:hypothetical protein
MPGAPEPSGRQLNPTRRTTSCLEDQDKKMPKENSPAEWMPKVHFQTGGIRPISDRHPQFLKTGDSAIVLKNAMGYSKLQSLFE